MTFKEYVELREGFPGTKENDPGNAAWASPETRVWKHPVAFNIPKKPIRVHKKELEQLPPHLANDEDVIASTKFHNTRRNSKTGRIRDAD